jgi:hypothetical protein
METAYWWGIETAAPGQKHYSVLLKTPGGVDRAENVAPALEQEWAYISALNAAFEKAVTRAQQAAGFDFVEFNSRAFGRIEHDPKDKTYTLSAIVLNPKVLVRYDYEIEWAEDVLKGALRECLKEHEVITDVRLEPEITFEQATACA